MKNKEYKYLKITVPNIASIILAALLLIGSGFAAGYFLKLWCVKQKGFQYPDPLVHILEHEFFQDDSLPLKRYADTIKIIQDNLPMGTPTTGHKISSFGWRSSPFGHWKDYHSGIDLVSQVGAPIRATAAGTVMFTGWYGGYGIMIMIAHKYGFESIYAHCSSSVVYAGQYVARGQLLGYVGKTGNVTGPHCHYEVRLSVPIDPTDIGAIFQ